MGECVALAVLFLRECVACYMCGLMGECVALAMLYVWFNEGVCRLSHVICVV